ncbi:MAG: hypothetical protein ACLRWQ_01680 [Flavonifractor plautii]
MDDLRTCPRGAAGALRPRLPHQADLGLGGHRLRGHLHGALTYYLATARVLIGAGPLMLCPAPAGLAMTTVAPLPQRRGTGRTGRPALPSAAACVCSATHQSVRGDALPCCGTLEG